jgi:RNA methyltransferase, TrmH family
MITKTEIKVFKSLSEKKFRLEHGLFLVEGLKSVEEVIKSRFKIERLLCSVGVQQLFENSKDKLEIVDERVIQQISSFTSAQQAIAVCKIEPSIVNWDSLKQSMHLYLSSIRDPGNLGTIIRLADWFGMNQIFCSLDTVDGFSPKVIQATMGSFCRVDLHYMPLAQIIQEMDQNLPIYAAALNGDLLNTTALIDKGILMIGNEANGLSADDLIKAKQLLRIPGPFKSEGPESLNAAMATSILLSAFKKII